MELNKLYRESNNYMIRNLLKREMYFNMFLHTKQWIPYLPIWNWFLC